ncbi:MAG: hypothetical protein JRI25_06700 [Deltaproteobacteria bacterium]|nr:hypothetical protein [Deltaproteobacteria bacterium]
MIYETRTGRQDLLAMVGFRSWQDMVYAGNGGADVVVDWGDAEVGNWSISPFFLFGASQHAWLGAFYAQGFYRYSDVEPEEGNLLDERAPTGAFGGHYTDLTVGYFLEQVDQWPLPNSGWRGDLSLSGGGAVVKDKVGFLPNLGVNGAFVGWWPALGPRLVIGGRLLAAKRAGDRPFFEGEFAGGRRRDEVGFEKALTGYGRTRTRGDGAVAALVEVRPFLGRTHHRFWDLSAYLSLFAEEAWLFDGFDPGPHLPTLGVGGVVVWQGATMLRPFVAWGWRADEPGGPRHAAPQFGLAMQDPL